MKSMIPRCYLLGFKLYLPLPHTPLILPGGASGENWPANAGEMQVQSLSQEDPLEKGMATHFSILFFFKFIYFNWRRITLQYCSGFAIH